MDGTWACYTSESGPFIRPQNVGTPLVQPSPSRRPLLPSPTREILPGLFDFLADMKRSRAKLRFTLFTDRSDPTYPSKTCIHS